MAQITITPLYSLLLMPTHGQVNITPPYSSHLTVQVNITLSYFSHFDDLCKYYPFILITFDDPGKYPVLPLILAPFNDQGKYYPAMIIPLIAQVNNIPGVSLNWLSHVPCLCVEECCVETNRCTYFSKDLMICLVYEIIFEHCLWFCLWFHTQTVPILWVF